MRMMASLAAAAMLAAGTGTISAESAGNAVAKARTGSAQAETDRQDRQAPRGQIQVQRRRVECPPDIDLRPLRRADPTPHHKSPGTRAKARWKRARRSSRR